MYNRDIERQQYEDWHRYGRERGWFDRASDEVRSWFGDEEAERRRRMDAQMRGETFGREDRSWGREDRWGRDRERFHREDLIPEWQRRQYSGPSPRGSEMDQSRGRYDMDLERMRHEARQRHWTYGGDMERPREMGSDYRYGREGYGMMRGRQDMFGGREEYERERSLSERRPQGLGNRFFSQARDFESGMGWGGYEGGMGRNWEEEQGWGQRRGMFGGERGGGFFDRDREDRERGGFFGGLHRGRGPRNYQRSDERVIDEIHQILTFHPEIDASDIEVLVDKGIVTLRGKVDNRYMKRLTEDLCEDVYGVREVHNELRVDNGLFQRDTSEKRPAGNNLIPNK